jgi:hypothetical protein
MHRDPWGEPAGDVSVGEERHEGKASFLVVFHEANNLYTAALDAWQKTDGARDFWPQYRDTFLHYLTSVGWTLDEYDREEENALGMYGREHGWERPSEPID